MSAALLLVAFSALAAAHVAPLQTPAPNINPELLRRQDITAAPSSASSFATRTFAYFSGGDTEGLVLWAPITYQSEIFTFTSSGLFWRGCSRTFFATIGTSVTSDTACPMFTTCSDGWLLAESTSYYCVQQSLSCYTELLYQTYGASDALSWLYCGTSSVNATNTAYYRTKPPADIPATTSDVSDSVQTSPTPNPSPSPPGPEPTTPTPDPEPKKKSNNAGAIAGGVVGGVAVLALAGVAIFWLLMRRKKNNAAATAAAGGAATQPPATSGTAGPYPNDAKPANVQVGEYYAPPVQGQGGYNPQRDTVYSMQSTSPTMGPAVPPYEPQGQHSPPMPHTAYRNELPS